MPVQEVILGKIIDNQKEKFCVACKDFKEKRLAPVYDCGSCLYPSATDNDLKDFLKSKEEIEKRKELILEYSLEKQIEKIK